MIHKVSVVVVEVLLVADLAPPFLWLFEQIPCRLQALMALPIADYSFRRRQSCVDGCRTAEVISSFALCLTQPNNSDLLPLSRLAMHEAVGQGD